jgi:ferritin-like metal-binding protein YciE/gas vesicle protein
MRLETLRKLYVTQLRELYNAENQILAGLTKMATTASHPQLKQAFEQHRVETKNQVERLEQIFKSLGESPKGETSKALLGLITEGEQVIKAKGDEDVIDAGLIGAAQKIEHYEISSYGTLLAYAKQLGDQQALRLLRTSLDEEYAADKKLTALAETTVNADAGQNASSSDANYNSYSNASYRNSAYGQGTSPNYGSSSYQAYESDSSSISISGLVLGAAAGVALGLLLAPNTGMDTRRRILDGANSLLDQVGGQFGGLTDTLRSTVNRFTGGNAADETATTDNKTTTTGAKRVTATRNQSGINTATT